MEWTPRKGRARHNGKKLHVTMARERPRRPRGEMNVDLGNSTASHAKFGVSVCVRVCTCACVTQSQENRMEGLGIK